MPEHASLGAAVLGLALALALPAAAQEPAVPHRAAQLRQLDEAIQDQVDRRRLGGMVIVVGGLIALGGAVYDAGKLNESGWAALGGSVGLALAVGGASTMHDAGMQLHELQQQRDALAATPALRLGFRFGAP